MSIVKKKKSTKGTTAKPGPRRRLTADDARDAILNAAEAILNRAGPQGLKLAEVAKANRASSMKELQLSTEEKAQLVAFIGALSSPRKPFLLPELPR